MPTALLISGSPRGVPPALLHQLARDASLIIAIDHGADFARQARLTPDVLLGDFDSLALATLAHFRQAGVELCEHHWHKNATDLELALAQALSRGYDNIVAANALGGRVDHELAALSALVGAAEQGASVTIVEQTETLHILTASHRKQAITLDFAAREGQQDASGEDAPPIQCAPSAAPAPPIQCAPPVSLIPWGGSALVSARGFEWPLDHATLSPTSSRGVSNIARSEAPQVEVHEGTLLVILSKEAAPLRELLPDKLSDNHL
jgi:thiamine pyrophosphokinase